MLKNGTIFILGVATGAFFFAREYTKQVLVPIPQHPDYKEHAHQLMSLGYARAYVRHHISDYSNRDPQRLKDDFKLGQMEYFSELPVDSRP